MTSSVNDELRKQIAEKLEDILGQNYVDEYSGSAEFISVDEIATQLLPLLEDTVLQAEKRGELNGRILELEKLADRMDNTANSFKLTAINMAKKNSGVEGLAHGQKMASFGWMQATRQVKDRLEALRKGAKL